MLTRARLAFASLVLVVLLAAVTFLPALASDARPRPVFRPAAPAQVTITLLPVEDAGVESPQPDHGYGTDTSMRAYYQGVNELGRVLLRFALADQIPADAIVDSASLRLYLTDSYNTSPVAFIASNVADEWLEGRVTWNNQPAATSPSVVDQMIDGVVPGYKTVDVRWIVEAWRSGPNYGLQLKGPEGGPTGFRRTFQSREAGTYPPQLDITYHLPPPGPGVWSDFSPSDWMTVQTTGCSVRIQDAAGVNPATGQYRFSSNGGATWSDWLEATTRGTSTNLLLIAGSVPFGQDSLVADRNQIVFRIRNSVDEWETSPTYIVYIDSMPPAYPTDIGANRPTATWSNDSGDVLFTWSAAADATSGTAGYGYQWSNAPDTIPEAILKTSGLSLLTPIPDDGIWYFHVRAVDHAGNWSIGAAHLGPFWLDTVPPTNITAAQCPGHSPGVWSNDNTVACQWSGAIDYRSGVAGYSFTWDQSASTVPDTSLDTYASSMTSPALTDGTNWYLHLRAIDYAGNAAVGASHLGPFEIDTIAPASYVYIQDPYEGTTSFAVQWFGDAGSGSPIVGYDVQVTDNFGGTSTTTEWLSSTALSSGTYTGAVQGHYYCFSSRARDAAGNLEAYPSAQDDCTLIGAPTQVTVTDEFGTPKQGARVYHRDRFVGLTDAQGRITLSSAMFGDHLVALLLVSTQGSGKGDHSEDSFKDWSWRVYRTNLSFDTAGTPQWDSVSTVSSLYNQTVPVYRNWPLIGMHVVVSVEWDATAAYLDDLAQGVRSASGFLYDVGDGQFMWEVVEIYDNAAHWDSADIHVYASNQVWPMARVGGMTQGGGAYIHLPRLFSRSTFNSGFYTSNDGFTAMIHEFGHYGLGLYDEYRDRGGNETTDAFCATNFASAPVASRASIMYEEWLSSELCSRIDANHQHRTNTEQDAKNGGSTWDTVQSRFSDPNVNPYWYITTPDERGATMPGPTAIPVAEWMRVIVTNANTGTCPAFTLPVTVSGNSVDGVDVWVDPQGIWWQFPYNVQGLYQGRTDAFGNIGIFGAHPGDTILAMKLPNIGLMTASCTAATASATASASAVGPGLELTEAPFTVSVAIDALGAQAMQVRLAPSVVLAATPAVVVQQDGSHQGIPVTLTYDAAQNTYSGPASLSPELDASGYVFVRAEAGGQAVQSRTPFALAAVAAGEYEHLWSADGNLELVLRANTLSQDAVVGMQQVDNASDAQESLVRVSPAYSLSLSTGNDALAATATVHMRYLPGQLGGVIPGTLRLYRWDEASGQWLALDSSADTELNSVSAQVSQLGVFAVLGTGSRIYLPLTRQGPR